MDWLMDEWMAMLIHGWMDGWVMRVWQDEYMDG